VPGWKDIMASEIKEVIDSFKNTDILVDFYSPSYDVFYNKSKGTYEITTTKGSFVSKNYDEVVDWYYDLVTDNGKYLLTI
jgi:GTP1/Obg family GTP-binding protein